jgi:hypothetical protein
MTGDRLGERIRPVGASSQQTGWHDGGLDQVSASDRSEHQASKGAGMVTVDLIAQARAGDEHPRVTDRPAPVKAH